MNNYWVNNTNPMTDTPAAATSGASTGLSAYTPYIGPVTAALSYAPDPLGKLNQDLSNPLSGAMTGAAIGSYGGPVGAAIGGIIGLGAGTVGRAFGLGKTKKVGSEVLGGTYNTPGDMTRVSKGQYDSYNQAMDYLNNYNANNVGWNNVGASQYGQDVYKTKRIGHNKKSYDPWYAINMNTGYNVLDDFSNARGYAGTPDWNTWMNREADILSGRTDRLIGKPNYELSDYYDIANQVNAQKYQDALDTLYAQKVMGTLDNSQYDEALKQLSLDNTRNRIAMYDIGKWQTNQWKNDMNQLYDDYKKTQVDDWIKYYGNYDAASKLSDAADAVQAYKNNYVSDNLLRYLMSSSSEYEPYRYIATGIAKSPVESLYGWSNNRRKAVPLYQEV